MVSWRSAARQRAAALSNTSSFLQGPAMHEQHLHRVRVVRVRGLRAAMALGAGAAAPRPARTGLCPPAGAHVGDPGGLDP